MSQTLNSMSDNVRPRLTAIVSSKARRYAADHYSFRTGASAIDSPSDPCDSGTGNDSVGRFRKVKWWVTIRISAHLSCMCSVISANAEYPPDRKSIFAVCNSDAGLGNINDVHHVRIAGMIRPCLAF